MEPGEDPQRANLNGARRGDLQAPQIGVVLGCNVHGPYGPASGDQAGEALFRANALQDTLLWRQLTGLRNGNDRNELGLRLNVALASKVQIDVVSWM